MIDTMDQKVLMAVGTAAFIIITIMFYKWVMSERIEED